MSSQNLTGSQRQIQWVRLNIDEDWVVPRPEDRWGWDEVPMTRSELHTLSRRQLIAKVEPGVWRVTPLMAELAHRYGPGTEPVGQQRLS